MFCGMKTFLIAPGHDFCQILAEYNRWQIGGCNNGKGWPAPLGENPYDQISD
jgi:hypothetical protein